jgi:hypothetical protein
LVEAKAEVLDLIVAVVALPGCTPGRAAIAVRGDSVEDIIKSLNRIVIKTVSAAVRRK